MIILPVAIMREIRPQLLELSSEMSSSFPFFFRKNLIVDVKRLLSIASSMSTSFSGDSTPTAGLGNSGERLRKAMESDKGEAIFPLPKGHYPLHDGYPLARKDGEAIEVNELLKASNIMLEEKSTILELKERMNECLEDHLEWVQRQKQKVLSDTAARDRRAKDEWRHIEDVRKIEKEVLESRVQVMAQIDELARKEIKVLEDLQESKSNGLKSEEDLESKRRVSEIEIAQLREISEQAELHAHGKILGILRRRSIVDS